VPDESKHYTECILHNLKTIKNWLYEVLEVEKVAVFKTYLTRKRLKV